MTLYTKIHDIIGEDGKWNEVQGDMTHSDWVRDVAWAPSTGLDRCVFDSDILYIILLL